MVCRMGRKNVFFSWIGTFKRSLCSTYQLSIVETDTQGRYLIAKLLIEKTPEAFFFINIYAPNGYREQEQFIKILSENIAAKTDISKVLIAGDWNTTLKQTDKYGGIPWKETAYRNSIIDLMEELGLQDIYRKLHPNTKSFTYETKNLKLKSRIDFLLVSNSIVSKVKRAEIRSSIAPDHKAIFLGIEVRSSLERGPGSWKFNNTLLDDEKYKGLIRFIYPQIREKYKDVESKQLLWELIKMEIRAKTIKFSKSKRSELKKRELTLQTELEELDRKICNRTTNMDQDQDVLKAYDAAKGELKEIYNLRCKEAIFRSRAKWIEEGEKPTKYFFNLEKRNYEKKTILQVKLENGKTTSDLKKVNKEIGRFFSNMFTTKLAGIPLVQQKSSFNSLVEGL